MLIGRTKHILYIKIQTSSDNNRISFFKKKRRRKKENKNSCDAFLAFVCMFTRFKSVYCHKIDCPLLQLSVSIIGALASLIRLMLRDNAISRLR